MADDGGTVKKRRLRNACDECRRRKIRCDSAIVAGRCCTSCATLKVECTHNLQKKKRGPKIGLSKHAESARTLVNLILSSPKSFIIPEDPEEVREILVDIANFARTLDRQLDLAKETTKCTSADPNTSLPSQSSSPPATNDVSEHSVKEEPVDSIDSLTQDLRQLTVERKARHFGKSSNFMLVQSAVDARRDFLGDGSFAFAVFTKLQRPEFWKPSPWQLRTQKRSPHSYTFPPNDLFVNLVDLYFVSTNTVFPLLHRQTFERSIAEGLHLVDSSFGATVLAVCAIASRFSNDPRNLDEETTSPHSAGWKYFSQIPLIRDSFIDPPSLYDIQLCSLSTLYLQTTSSAEATWTIVGIGIRAAQEMGIHQRSERSKDRIQDELWKRAFWVLVSIDLFMSTLLGRPRATTPDDFDVEFPVECDDEYWNNPDPDKMFVQPEGKPSVVSFFVTFLKLLEIIGFAQRSLYSVRKSKLWTAMGMSGTDWKKKAVLELDSALNKFWNEIPDHLRWNPENPDSLFFEQSVLLYSTAHWIQIQVHRPFIPRPGHQAMLAFPSLTICCTAARSTLNMIELLHARIAKGLIPVPLNSLTNILTPLFTSAMILLLNVWRPQQPHQSTLEREKELGRVHRCMRIIKTYESKYLFAGRLVDIITAVLAIGELPRNGNSKRPRSPSLEDQHEYPPAPSHAQEALLNIHDAIHRGEYEQSPDTTSNGSKSLPPHPEFHSYSQPHIVQHPDISGAYWLPPSETSAPSNTQFATDIPIQSQFTQQDELLPDLWGDLDFDMSGYDLSQESWNMFMTSMGDWNEYGANALS